MNETEEQARMSDNAGEIAELERRINSALGRIEGALAGADATPQANPEELAQLQEALDVERATTAQLEERVRSLREAQADELGRLSEGLSDAKERLTVKDTEISRLKSVIAQLRDSNRALREANQTGVGEPHLINKSMMTELEAMRSVHASELEEVDAVMKALRPIVEESA